MMDDFKVAQFGDNDKAELARILIEETSANVFLTGKAGTGKTTLLKTLRERSNKRIVVLAPTGIAAINAGGVTIHSFFQLPIGPYVPGRTELSSQKRVERFSKAKLRLIRNIDLLVIDEISMARADVIDAMDASLRRHRNPSLPFGGVQLLMIGDLQQLAPVVKPDEWEMLGQVYDTPYFFSSIALRNIKYEIVELEHVFRQTDPVFTSILNKVRSNSLDAEGLKLLNSRVCPGFQPRPEDGYIRLVTHNAQANTINQYQLEILKTQSYTYVSKVEGDFPENSFPADANLQLKVGAQVMFLRNDPGGKYYNGLIGTVVQLTAKSVAVSTSRGDECICVEPVQWDNIRYDTDSESGKIVEETVGSFSQMPLRLAWAVTVHKSQGLTFERAIIDVSRSFAHGQTYVALSRCKTLEGLVLETPIVQSAIICDDAVNAFSRNGAACQISNAHLNALKQDYYWSMLAQMVDFTQLKKALESMSRLVEQYIVKTYPVFSSQYTCAMDCFERDIVNVAGRFVEVCRTHASKYNLTSVDDYIKGRIKDAARYFAEKLAPFLELINHTPTACDNRNGANQIAELKLELIDDISCNINILNHVADLSEFNPTDYLNIKAKERIQSEIRRESQSETKRKNEAKKKADVKAKIEALTGDIRDNDLYEALVEWRTRVAKEKSVPAYVVAHTKALIAVANAHPASLGALKRLPGWGAQKVKTYGEEVLSIVASIGVF